MGSGCNVVSIVPLNQWKLKGPESEALALGFVQRGN